MPYELYIERRAENDLKKLEESLFSEIIARIKELSDNPRPHGSKKIAGSQNDWATKHHLRSLLLLLHFDLECGN
jgi:mRNA-degrading endonuclease RelE of RelBE toxin-antitoxin system